MKSELNEDVSGSAEVIYATTTIRGVEIPDKGIFKSHNYLHFLIMMTTKTHNLNIRYAGSTCCC